MYDILDLTHVAFLESFFLKAHVNSLTCFISLPFLFINLPLHASIFYDTSNSRTCWLADPAHHIGPYACHARSDVSGPLNIGVICLWGLHKKTEKRKTY